MINIAIIGANFGTKVHLPACKLIEDINISAICSKRTNNWIDIIKDKNIDAICLSVPPIETYSILKEAIINNKHIFCEKPLSSNLDNAIKINELLNNSNIIHAINFEMCESKIVKRLRKLITSKYLGKIKSFDFNWNAITYNKNHIWKHNISLGGGALNNFGSHTFNLLEYIFNDQIKNISGEILPSLEYNTYINLFTEFSNFNGSICINSDTEIPSDIMLIVSCEYGNLILKNDTGILKNFSLLKQIGNKLTVIKEEQDIPKIDGRIELTSSIISKFINGIKAGTQIHPNIKDGLRAQFLIDQTIKGKII